MSLQELEKQLVEAQAFVQQMFRSKASFIEALAAYRALAEAQRALAAAKGEEYAVPVDIGFVPEAAVSEPVVLQTDQKTILTFSAVRPMPDGKRQNVGYGIVEFDLCHLTKFGYPNDEALPGHPLHNKGLAKYGVYEVKNSLWTKLLTEQNRICFPKTPDSTSKHFIFTFHDSTFECIARSFSATLSSESYGQIFSVLAKKVLGQTGYF